VSTDSLAEKTTEWPEVQTDAGPVTLATAEALRSRAAQWRAWAGDAAASANGLRTQAEDHLAQAGAALVSGDKEWPIPAGLQPTIDGARALTQQVAANDDIGASLKLEEKSAGFFKRISVRRQEHHLEQDRSRASEQLRALLIQIARAAPQPSVSAADTERTAAANLETQAASLDAKAASTRDSANAWDEEAKRRDDAIKAMGFDSLYMAASL